MTINKMVNETFQAYTREDWVQKVEEALKGKSVESLDTNTYENIKLKALYTKEDVKDQFASQYPGQSDFRRGHHSLGFLTEEWRIAQRISGEDDRVFRENLLSAIEKGQSALSFDMEKLNINELESVVGDLYTKLPFSIEVYENQRNIISQLSKLSDCKKISGYIAADPLAQGALKGETVQLETFDEFAEIIQVADQNMPKLRTLLINTSVYHNAGTHDVQELAIAISAGVHNIEELVNRKLNVETIFEKMVFKFSIGANFFMEISKLRAARILWAKIAEAYGVKNHQMVIAAETSLFTKTAYDPYVNLLRAGNEAFAAVLGGIQYLHVGPFNEVEGKTTAFSERIARNTQFILKNESHLEKVIDPAGGSWYIESLTNELAQKAWSLFLEMEELGGIAETIQTGWLQAQISDVLNKRSQDIFTRKKSIIGTNVYANLDEKPLEFLDSISNQTRGIPQVRLSEPFEKLRKLAEKITATGNKSAIGLICLGKLKDHKTRKDFITGFFAPGGIHTYNSQSIFNVEMAFEFLQESNLSDYVICGNDQQYDETAFEIIRFIKERKPHIRLFLAGLPDKDKREAFEQAGIDQFIHLRSNCYDVLSSLLSKMEVASNA
ncbi:methylmalonyl-CoA mutase [Cytobacillus depressus]|uniref:Methylmalonyl-CoA mutase n=1 Tax=Cytobacillus depressus TaxID=1602942 RepID=A0A6L3V9U9_9BACI|nr:methylmalonyl-CoA mutase subunit beta [Cytobacillus depressus]KAB2338448.1 methylmalonyl-CoA mutase [Cytobacillus depressus]